MKNGHHLPVTMQFIVLSSTSARQRHDAAESERRCFLFLYIDNCRVKLKSKSLFDFSNQSYSASNSLETDLSSIVRELPTGLDAIFLPHDIQRLISNVFLSLFRPKQIVGCEMCCKDTV